MLAKFATLPAPVQAILAAAAGAVVPALPGLLDTPPSVTPRDLLKSALSAACAVAMLFLHKPGTAPKADA